MIKHGSAFSVESAFLSYYLKHKFSQISNNVNEKVRRRL